MIRSKSLGEDDDPFIEHDSTVVLSVKIKTSDQSKLPSLASSSRDSITFVNSRQLEDSPDSSAPQTPIQKVKPEPHVKVDPNPVPDASPKPYTTATMDFDRRLTTGGRTHFII